MCISFFGFARNLHSWIVHYGPTARRVARKSFKSVSKDLRRLVIRHTGSRLRLRPSAFHVQNCAWVVLGNRHRRLTTTQQSESQARDKRHHPAIPSISTSQQARERRLPHNTRGQSNRQLAALTMQNTVSQSCSCSGFQLRSHSHEARVGLQTRPGDRHEHDTTAVRRQLYYRRNVEECDNVLVIVPTTLLPIAHQRIVSGSNQVRRLATRHRASTCCSAAR